MSYLFGVLPCRNRRHSSKKGRTSRVQERVQNENPGVLDSLLSGLMIPCSMRFSTIAGPRGKHPPATKPTLFSKLDKKCAFLSPDFRAEDLFCDGVYALRPLCRSTRGRVHQLRPGWIFQKNACHDAMALRTGHVNQTRVFA